MMREQQKTWERNHQENRATGKEGETKHSLRKRRNGSMPEGYFG
jgi:hypothetical protein